jgi:hypothetical protein
MSFDVADILNLLLKLGVDRPAELTSRNLKKTIRTIKFSKSSYEKIKDDAVLEAIFRLLLDCKKKKLRYKLRGALPNSKKKSNTTKKKDKANESLKPSREMGSDEKSKQTVVASIIEFLGEGTPEKPVQKEDVLGRLAERFPEKDEQSIQNTFGTLVPGRLWELKEIEVIKSPRGYWIHN